MFIFVIINVLKKFEKLKTDVIESIENWDMELDFQKKRINKLLNIEVKEEDNINEKEEE